ncbi:MAG: hypothetical protein KAZ45_02200 [Arenimonas sp.]|nr:hypothetical protein [Arenimonas sp.]
MAYMPGKPWRILGAAAILSTPLLVLSLEAPEGDPSISAAEMKPKASHSLLLDIAKTDAGYVAVGERGHILVSADGKTWQQVKAPTRSTLTTVSTQGAAVWTAGHDGVILNSTDAGKTWQRQRAQPWSADSQLLTNGSPVLDTLFVSASEGYAVGAYSLLLKTLDGGTTWTELSIGGSLPAQQTTELVATDSGVFDDSDLTLAAESDPHLNAIARTASGRLLVMGERGAGFRSDDSGATWKSIRLPYGGSVFGLLSLGGEQVLSFGLRGNIYQSDDAGSVWRKIDSGTETSLIGGTVSADGSVLLVGGNGTVALRRPGASTFTVKQLQLGNGQTPAFTAAVGDAGAYILTSDLGAINSKVQ